MPRPRVPGDLPAEPFKREEIDAMGKAYNLCVEAETTDRRKVAMQRAAGKRDRATLFMLLDTGLWASELYPLRIVDVDLKSGKIQIRGGIEGKAKGRKGRTIYIGKADRRFLWRYLIIGEHTGNSEAPLFIGKSVRAFNRDVLRQVIAALGEKAGIKKAHPPASGIYFL